MIMYFGHIIHNIVLSYSSADTRMVAPYILADLLYNIITEFISTNVDDVVSVVC